MKRRFEELTFSFLITQECSNHLSSGRESESHFRAVCRALVSEAVELSTFLEKVSQFDTERAEELKELDMQDWVREHQPCEIGHLDPNGLCIIILL